MKSLVGPALGIKVSVSYLRHHMIHADPVESRHILSLEALCHSAVLVDTVEINESLLDLLFVLVLVQLEFKPIHLHLEVALDILHLHVLLTLVLVKQFHLIFF